MNEIRYLVKFGEQAHLQGLMDGLVYFSDAKHFIELEKEQLKRGQGDRIEGKSRLAFENLKMYNHETKDLAMEAHRFILDVDYPNVPTMPVFCLTAIWDNECCEIGDSVAVLLPDDVKEKINASFEKG